jgi:hypothetical protein
MRRFAVARTVFSLMFVVFVSATAAVLAQTATGSQLNPCAAPNEIGDSIEETAWQIWVAATCPVNDNQYPFVVWKNWIEQAQLYPAAPSNGLKVPNSGAPTAPHILHNSPLTVRVNGAAEDYIAGTNLWKRIGQAQAAANGVDIQFPLLLLSSGRIASELPMLPRIRIASPPTGHADSKLNSRVLKRDAVGDTGSRNGSCSV